MGQKKKTNEAQAQVCMKYINFWGRNVSKQIKRFLLTKCKKNLQETHSERWEGEREREKLIIHHEAQECWWISHFFVKIQETGTNSSVLLIN